MDFPGQDKNVEMEQAGDGASTGAPADAATGAEADAASGGSQAAGGDGGPAQMAEQLAQAQAQAAEYLDQLRRTTAEFSNARKRMQREQAEQQANANARLLEKLIPVVDDVDRAFGALPPEDADNEWVQGFRLIQRKLNALIEGEGVSVIEAEGKQFDPAVHYAVSHEEQEGFNEGDVIAEVAKGYRLGDRVLRPAMVRVAKG